MSDPVSFSSLSSSSSSVSLSLSASSTSITTLSTLTADLEQLAEWRQIGARRSEQVISLGQRVLRSKKLGDQEWSIREQVAIAAFDLGKMRLGIDQLDLLNAKFPNSPRVQLVHGLRLEARGDLDGARAVYEALLKADETNVSAHQRLIALCPTPITKIPALLKYLDTFYTDPAGWSFLAELYADLGLYAQSFSALGHLLLIQPWDTFAIIRCAETCYTMRDYQLSLKYFLRAVEMETEPKGSLPAEKTKSRAWWGSKLCTKRLLSTSPSTSLESATHVVSSSLPEDMVIPVEKLQALDQLATSRLIEAGGAGLRIRRKVLGEQGVLR